MQGIAMSLGFGVGIAEKENYFMVIEQKSWTHTDAI
jgi:hypothetical protein